MTWLDIQHMRSGGSPSLSPDGRWMLYTVSTPSWKDATTQTDIHLVSTERGLSSARQLTFTGNRNETQPRWAPGGEWFVFLSNRDASPTAGSGSGSAGSGSSADSGNQLFLMRPDGGEARRITQATPGVSTFAFSRDGRWLVYRAGRPTQEQLFALPVADLTAGREVTAQQLTKHPTGIGQWRFAPDGKRIYFVTADTIETDERARTEKRFTVAIRNPVTPTSSLWALDLDGRRTTRLTRDTSISVTDFAISDDSRWVGFRALPSDRYMRGITEQGIHSNLYLAETATGRIEQLTGNHEVSESALSFSPDSRLIAFTASDDTTGYNMKNSRVYVRSVAGGPWRKLGTGFDGDVSVGFWSPDGRTIYFNEGIRATNQVMAVDVASGRVRQLTSVQGVVSANHDEESGRTLLSYADPRTPTTMYAISSIDRIGDRRRWTQLTDINPQVAEIALGEEEEITWTSTDGTQVGGVLVKPVGYTPGRRYPLIVAIHGGPASADLLGFNGGYGAQVYAGEGYVVLKPNYRGSTNYGEKFRNDIVGNYFDPGYHDIMTGVDRLIAEGLVDSTQMGVLGWSAGGHWSNWILTHTDRFKAISSGAGTSNWISMYAQSDVQRNRQYYLGNKLPYEDFDAYWNQSPLRYITNAKTPTMIHVVEGDPRVPSAQSIELHMALKKLGVPTELFIYPGNTHGIPDARNRLLKGTAEKMWMDYYVRGSGRQFAWRDVLQTLEEEKAATAAEEVR
jgi:dipeptidyl aminopeptidase/acylaminoacyl peptidase